MTDKERSSVDGRAVLVLAYGGPEKKEDIGPFLDNVLQGRPLPPERRRELAGYYERLGGVSPVTVLTPHLARELGETFRREGTETAVYVAMRHGKPSIPEVVRRMAEAGVRRAVGVVLSVFRSEFSWDGYLAAVDEAVRALGPAAPTVRYVEPWHEEALFIEAQADRIEEVKKDWPADRLARARWIFTAHGIPCAADPSSGYSQQFARSAELLARRLGVRDYVLAYQSRGGRPQDPWLGPDLQDVLNAPSDSKDVLVVPLGFLSDHMEVLYDLDVKAQRVAAAAGLRFARAKTVGTHPAFLRLLAGRIGQTWGKF
ncbi:MAG TPA: ferrochelatase [Elusimicrobiota bacterium]|nr:ferrochelatase [Elusimicrobiota bacterium]